MKKNDTSQKLLPPTDLYMEAKRRLEMISGMRVSIENRVKAAPQGSIHVIKKWGNPQFYLRGDSSNPNGQYISKTDMRTIKTHLQKSYDEKVLKLLEREEMALRRELNSCAGIVEEMRKIYSDNPPKIKELISPIDCSDEDFANYWMNIPYEKKEILTDSEQITEKGETVRSKSELNIANALYKYGIPYKYECPLILIDGQVIHPDFTVLNLKQRKTVYWEHRGMMDDRGYAKHSVSRIRDYQKSGIYLGDNLIITEETTDCVLGTREIERVIRHYFLN